MALSSVIIYWSYLFSPKHYYLAITFRRETYITYTRIQIKYNIHVLFLIVEYTK